MSYLTAILLSLSVFLLTFQLSAVAAPLVPEQIGSAWVYRLPNKQYAQAREDLTSAIEEQGMVISAVSHVKDMLDRTQTDLGYTSAVYATGGETVMFCKADLSQSMMRSNPHNISLCPYGISIYTLSNKPNVVFLSYRVAPNLPVYQPIEALLKTIIERVAE